MSLFSVQQRPSKAVAKVVVSLQINKMETSTNSNNSELSKPLGNLQIRDNTDQITDTMGDIENRIFDEIIDSVSIDFENQEIKDIKNVTYTMLDRIVAKVNERGIFSIARIQPAGSMTDKTSNWKYDKKRVENFLEFDSLAVLRQSLEQFIVAGSEDRCAGCVELSIAPVKLERLTQHNDSESVGRTYTSEGILEPIVINELFMNEINTCLSLLCNCLATNIHTKGNFYHQIKLQHSDKMHEQGCDNCRIESSTGTLTVNTSISLEGGFFNPGPSNSSLIFSWTSKANLLTAPDQQCPHERHHIAKLPIYVDFIPALEALKQTSDGGYDHDYFVVSKHCNKYHADKRKRGWRKSSCMTEINAFSKDGSKTHRRCHQIIKYILEKSYSNTTWVEGMGIQNYDVKTVIVKHCLACPNASDDCFSCLVKILEDLFTAYDSGKLESCDPSTSTYNIISQHRYCDVTKFYFKNLLLILKSLGEQDSAESFIQRVMDMKFPSSSNN